MKFVLKYLFIDHKYLYLWLHVGQNLCLLNFVRINYMDQKLLSLARDVCMYALHVPNSLRNGNGIYNACF